MPNSEGALKTWRSKIAPTARGAIFRAKRWFYATFYSKSGLEGKEESRENWARLARLLVEKSNEEGVSDKAARVIIHYYDKDGIFRPVRAELEVYELRPIKTVEISEEELGG
ncbi:MAG: hypothetical protein DRJ41_02310 [Thermoprotei archaeon]|nr:MAG: hypothetical protein DRJ41_02310 [Thermoprotei archaeon]